MKTSKISKINLKSRYLTLAVLLATLLFPVLHSTAEPLRPTPHELAAIAATVGERLWYHEEEFLRNPALRAAPEHVIILHLARAPKHQRFIDHAIPYIFPETTTYTFCIPKKEPFVQTLALTPEGSATPVVQLKQGHKCQTREIVAGFYRLQVRHDGKNIGPDGEKAFIHVPRFKRGAGVGSGRQGQQLGATLSSFPSSCDPNTFNAPQFTFTAPNGLFVAAQSGQAVHTQTTPGDTFLGAWSICPDGSGNYTFGQPGFLQSSPTFFTASGPPSTDTSIYETTGTPLKLKLTDLGNGQFTLMANFGGALYPIVVGSDNVLHWATSGNPTVFTTTVKFYWTGPLPPLQSGEVALFPVCNYDDSQGVWVFNTNIPNFGLFTFFGGISLDGFFASVQVAPGTPAALSAETNYSGTTQFIASDIACLDSTPLGNYTASSLKVIPDRQLVAATDECQNCNLSGIDLSDLDLSGGQFRGSTFTGANLTNTIFQSASLNNANFTGVNTILTNTNLLGTIIQCTNFSGADLSSATFQFSGVVKPIVTTDFSCRLDLTGATINFNSFPLTQWRYFNLTGAKINNITGATLSTTTSPLNLSGVIFNQASLPQVQLDGANLSCASTPSGSVCTQMIETSLPSASLKKVNLGDTLLQGAHLDSANLDGANLCAAKLNESPTSKVSATLQGAFLRNVNLSNADLTGATLANANFYSTSTPTSCNPSACGVTTSCASAVNAKLNNAVFTAAYLDGVDFSGSTPQSADFSGAWLAGSHFTNANLSQDPSTGKRTDFTGSALQGTTFTNATITGANFTSAIVDLTHSTGQTLLAQLAPATHIAFPGYTPWAGSTLGCVEFVTKQNTGLPGTNSSNLCPDGAIGMNSDGSCSTIQWQTPKVPPPPLPTNCTLGTTDLNWIIVN